MDQGEEGASIKLRKFYGKFSPPPKNRLERIADTIRWVAMKIVLMGYGKMGKLVENVAHSRGLEIIAKISHNMPIKDGDLKKADVCIDFSQGNAVLSHVKCACSSSVPIVIGTTGWEHHLNEAKLCIEKKGGAALFAPNFSLGVFLFLTLLKEAKKLFAPSLKEPSKLPNGF